MNNNLNVSGTLTTGGAIDATGNNIMRGADALQLTHTGNCSLKITGGSYTYRYETQTDDEHYLWDGANNEVYHVSGDNQIWFQHDVNTEGGFFSNGIPITSSRRLKSNIKDIEENEIFSKLQFKQYNKKINNKDIFEFGVIADEVKELDPENKLGLYEEKIWSNGEVMDYIHYIKIFTLACNEIQIMKKEINELNKLIQELQIK